MTLFDCSTGSRKGEDGDLVRANHCACSVVQWWVSRAVGGVCSYALPPLIDPSLTLVLCRCVVAPRRAEGAPPTGLRGWTLRTAAPASGGGPSGSRPPGARARPEAGLGRPRRTGAGTAFLHLVYDSIGVCLPARSNPSCRPRSTSLAGRRCTLHAAHVQMPGRRQG